MFFLEVLINYILPVIYTSFVSLVLVLFFLFVFRIKDSNIRILFFFIPLIKPFIVIAERIDINQQYFQSMEFSGFFRLPDPINIINFFRIFDKTHLIISDINYLMLLLILLIIILVLAARWINLLFFYRKLAYEDRVGREDVPEIYGIIDGFTGKIKIKTPTVSLTHRDYLSPFVAGIKNYTMVLSPTLIERLSQGERETLIQHELSHIKRKDNLKGWIALILKDILFFNPFSHIAYYLIRDEQEKDSDKLVLKYSGKTKKEISKNILNIIIKMKSVSAPEHVSETAHAFTFSPFNLLSQIKLKNRVDSIHKTDPERIYSRTFTKILMYIVFIFLLLFQIIFIFKINGYFIFLR